MPRFSRFYSATEADAFKYINQHLPRRTEGASQLKVGDTDLLFMILNGSIMSTSRSRSDVNQPLFRRPSSPVQPIEQLLSVSGFRISHGITYREKASYHMSSCEDSTEWNSRSHTLSSDETSTQKLVISLPTSRIATGASNSSNGSFSDHGSAHVLVRYCRGQS
jgi:hypothetical protein